MKEKLITILERASRANGIVCCQDDEHDLAYIGRAIDDYLAIGVLAELLKTDKAEIIIKDESDSKVAYLMRLLHLEKRGD